MNETMKAYLTEVVVSYLTRNRLPVALLATDARRDAAEHIRFLLRSPDALRAAQRTELRGYLADLEKAS